MSIKEASVSIADIVSSMHDCVSEIVGSRKPERKGKHPMKAIGLLVITIVAALISYRDVRAIPNATDLRNGWYPNMPAVSETEVNKAIACLVDNGAPEGPELEANALLMPGVITSNGSIVGNDPNAPNYAPTDIVWRDKSGRVERTNAVLTYLSPGVAYVDLARRFDMPLSNLPKVRDCAAKMNVQPLVTMKASPIGSKIAATANYYASAGGDIDRFKGGAVYQDATGTYVKHEGILSLFTRAWWEKVQ